MKDLQATKAERRFVVSGDVLSTNAAALRQELSALLENPAPFAVLELDLRAASMVDSVGLNLLVWAWKFARDRGAETRVLLTSSDIERTFRFTRLSSYVEVVRER